MEEEQIKNSIIDIEAQQKSFQDRVDFLKDWRTNQQEIVKHPDSTPREVFEAKNKIYELETEIASKQGLINMRKKDIENMSKKLEAINNEVKTNYVPFVERLKKVKTDDAALNSFIKGIVDRSKKNQSIKEMANDYKLMKSILMAVEKQDAQRQEEPAPQPEIELRKVDA